MTGGAVLWEMHTSHLVDIGLGHVICFGQWAVRGQNACHILGDTLGDIALASAIFLLSDEWHIPERLSFSLDPQRRLLGKNQSPANMKRAINKPLWLEVIETLRLFITSQ